VDTHRQSEVGFAFCYLLGFELLPRLKHLKKQRLYRPHKQGEGEPYTNVQAILTRPLQWELIEAQFDAMSKFATALRLGTADAESVWDVHAGYEQAVAAGTGRLTVEATWPKFQPSLPRGPQLSPEPGTIGTPTGTASSIAWQRTKPRKPFLKVLPTMNDLKEHQQPVTPKRRMSGVAG
jgi:hypothetical protein